MQEGRHYRYYLPARENQEHAGPSSLPRLPAAGLEAAMVEQLRGALRPPGWVAEVVDQGIPTLAKAHITVAMFRLGQILDQLSPRITRVLVE